MVQRNILQWLEQDIYQARRKPAPSQHLKPSCPHSIYTNPLNWTPGKCVCLIHATEGQIGVFREYFHKLSPTARRLLPAPAGSVVDRSELVFGDWWLHPRFQAPLVRDNEEDVRALTSRFNELYEEVTNA